MKNLLLKTDQVNYKSNIKSEFDITKSTNLQSAYGTTIGWAQQMNENNPETLINQQAQYKKLYHQFLKNNKKVNQIIGSSKQKTEQNNIKSFISKSLDVRKKHDEFEQKFQNQSKMLKKKPIRTMINALNTITHKIGETDQYKRQQQKKLFFCQTKKVLQLEEECLLLEYYYKDKSEFIVGNKSFTTNISYLRNRNHSESKHKRIQPCQKEFEKLILTHNEQYFEKIKKINHIKQEKFKNQTFRKAQLNYQFKRQKNFAQMSEIIKQNRQNLLLQSSMKLSPSQIRSKQTEFNSIMKLFLKFAYIQQSKRAFFEYIDQQGMNKLTKFIIQNQFDFKIIQSVIMKIIQKITKYKMQPKLQFYDFKQFLDRINEIFKIDILVILGQKHPEYFLKPQQKYLNNNWQQVKKEMNSKKIKFSIKLIFESSGDKLVLKQFLPIKIVPKILSNIGISGNDISRTKLFETMYWNQSRSEGLNFKQFYFAFLMLGVKNNSLENLFKLLQKVKLKELLN